MSRVFKRNLKYLAFLARDAKPDTRAEADRVVKFYEDRKIKNITTAENYLLKLTSRKKNVRESGVRAFKKKEEDIQEFGLVSRRAIKKRKAALPKNVTFSLQHVFYRIDQDGTGKKRAQQTKTKYFQGYEQKYSGTDNITLKKSEEKKALELFEDIVGTFLEESQDPDRFNQLIKYEETNGEIRRAWEIEGYKPDAILLLKYQKIYVADAEAHTPQDIKRQNTKHICINYKYC